MIDFWLCFVPLFVAVDAIGVLPIYLALVAELPRERQKRVIKQSVATAIGVGTAFLFVGQGVLTFLGISVADFMIAGGMLLLAFAVRELFTVGRQPVRADSDTIGAVPLGVPLLTGPAVLATVLLLANQYGWFLPVMALICNLLIAGLIFWYSLPLQRLLGEAGTRTISKVICVLLAAFAVMMIRKGALHLFQELLDAASGTPG